MTDKTRVEKDSLGELKVPAEALYGIQTARARENFPISPFKPFAEFIVASALIKKAAAKVNAELGVLDRKKADAIIQAADEVLAGKHRDQFVVDVYQAGAGTSHNMNVNEVLANRAIEILGGKRGDYSVISPNDHVNMAQSTNDFIPTAMRVAALLMSGGLPVALAHLADTLDVKAREFDGIVKSGRTHLQDAVPVRLGQEFAAWAEIVREHRLRILWQRDVLTTLGIGGTAAGTGLNAHPEDRTRMCEELSQLTGYTFKPAANLMAAMQSMAPFVGLSGALRNLAQDLGKIANDLRLLASGPMTGLREIDLPAVQPGSSIMPGKVNPVMAEMLNMVCYQVIGCDATVAAASGAGQLELNVMMPVINFNLLTSCMILYNAVKAFTEKCVKGITASPETCRRYAESSLAIVTALNPKIGYLKAAEVAKEVLATGKSVVQIVRERKLLSEDEIRTVLDVTRMTGAGETGGTAGRPEGRPLRPEEAYGVREVEGHGEPVMPGASGVTSGIELMWKCTDCGHHLERGHSMPATCPSCGAPREHFTLVEED